jgi:NodT family efflux transporter outer membrane factor (OMF) lipoprotein
MRHYGFYLFILILGSCARVPQSDLAQVSDPIPLDRSVESALAREFFDEGGWPTERWWEMFEDPQLNALIELALIESPTINKALAKVSEAEQEARKEKAALFPKLDFDYEEQWQYFSKNGFIRSFYPSLPGGVKIAPTDNQLDLSLYFNYEIDFFGRNRNLFKAALGKARAERAEACFATLMLTTLIAQTYIELQTKLAQMDVLKTRLEQRNSLFELATARETHGLDPAIPVLEREQSLYAVEQTILQLEKEISLDRHMLSILVGTGPDTDIAPEPMRALFERSVAIPSDLSSDLLARRPDLTAQIWRVEAAAKEIGAAKADFYPRVNLMAFAQLESLGFNKLLQIGSKQGGLVPAVHLPIFTGGKLTAQLKGKVALFNEETYRYNEMLLSAAKEVADQIVTLSATFDSLSVQITMLETAEEQLELQNSRYKNGVSNFLTVLEREENLLTQHYQLFGYERDYLLSVLKMVKALGGGYHAHQIPSYERTQ